jgi:hypothetical protein
VCSTALHRRRGHASVWLCGYCIEVCRLSMVIVQFNHSVHYGFRLHASSLSHRRVKSLACDNGQLQLNCGRSGDQCGLCSEPPASPRLRAERQRYGQRQARRPIITTPSDSAHDITQYRLDRRDIVGIASLLNQHIISATVSIPLAGGRLRRRARILYVFATSAPRASASSEPSSAYHRRPERSGGLKESE